MHPPAVWTPPKRDVVSFSFSRLQVPCSCSLSTSTGRTTKPARLGCRWPILKKTARRCGRAWCSRGSSPCTFSTTCEKSFLREFYIYCCSTMPACTDWSRGHESIAQGVTRCRTPRCTVRVVVFFVFFLCLKSPFRYAPALCTLPCMFFLSICYPPFPSLSPEWECHLDQNRSLSRTRMPPLTEDAVHIHVTIESHSTNP